MKRLRFLPLLVLAVLLALGFVRSAAADDEVRIEVKTDPVELSESAPVLFTFDVANHSDFELHEISLSLDNALFEIEGMKDCVIPPGGSATFLLSYEVPDARIGLPLVFRFDWLQYGEPHMQEVSVTVARAVEPTIAIDRTVSSAYARQGESITLIYELRNDTKFDMTNITVIDEQISDNPIFRNHTLNAGGTISQSFVYTMGADSVVSAPVVTYDVNGKTKIFSAIDPVTLAMVDIRIDLAVEVGTPTALGVPFTLTATNNGNQAVTNIRITDELSNALHADSFSLAPGENHVLSYLVTPVATEPLRTVAFRLSGIDALGNAYAPSLEATYEVRPFVDDSQISVMLTSAVIEPWTAQTGAVTVRVIIRNTSQVELRNAVLSESTLGDLASYALLSTGETYYEDTLVIGSPRNLTFSVRATDPAGTERLLTGAMLTVAYPSTTGTPEPSAAPTPEPIDGILEGISAKVITVLTIVAAIVLLALIALLVLAILEHQRTGGIRFADEDDEEAEKEIEDESLSLLLDEKPRRLPPTRDPEEYVRIAEQRRKNYLPTKRPLMPPTEIKTVGAYSVTNTHSEAPSHEPSIGNEEGAVTMPSVAATTPIRHAVYVPRVQTGETARHRIPDPSVAEESPNGAEASGRPEGGIAGGCADPSGTERVPEHSFPESLLSSTRAAAAPTQPSDADAQSRAEQPAAQTLQKETEMPAASVANAEVQDCFPKHLVFGGEPSVRAIRRDSVRRVSTENDSGIN